MVIDSHTIWHIWNKYSALTIVRAFLFDWERGLLLPWKHNESLKQCHVWQKLSVYMQTSVLHSCFSQKWVSGDESRNVCHLCTKCESSVCTSVCQSLANYWSLNLLLFVNSHFLEDGNVSRSISGHPMIKIKINQASAI